MIETPHITQTTERPTAIIHVTIPRERMPREIGPGVDELMAAIAAQDIAPAGPWFTHHLRRPTDTFDFEISVPVSTPVAPTGRVRPSVWPAMKVARTIYHGPYEGLGEAWGEFIQWMDTNGHQPADDLWESYVVGPHSNPDPTTWRTELIRQVVQ
jgi:effector-binding domain-containing protein